MMSQSKKRVLIVDDEVDTLKLFKLMMELSGFETYTTLNSLEALTLARVEQPDVVLLDIMMPPPDGFQLSKMLRADPETRQLPIIFVTAYPALDLEDRRLASGGDLVVNKPVGMDDLLNAITKVESLPRNIPKELLEIQKSDQKSEGDSPSVPSPAKVAPPKPS